MNTLQMDSKIRKGEAIEMCGLTFYPILMSDYEMFIACKDIIELRMSSLPARFLVMDYASALLAMEIEAITTDDKTNRGLFVKFITLLLMSLRIDIEKANVGEMIGYTEDNKLASIRITQNNNTVDLTPQDLSFQIRPLIAKLNGLELPNEADNIELVKDAEELNKYNNRHAKPLNVNTTDLIASVAYNCHTRIKDIEDWTVAEFEATRKAIRRSRDNFIYTLSELSGNVKFKGGNPYPSWEFDVKNTDLGLIKVDELMKKLN